MERESQAPTSLMHIPFVLIPQVQALSQLCIRLESGVIHRKHTRSELLVFPLLIAEYNAPSMSFVKLGNVGRKIPIKDLIHCRIQRPGNLCMVCTGQLTRKVEAATTGRLHDFREKGAELPRCKIRKGIYGVRVLGPIKCMVVQRLTHKIIHSHIVQRCKIFIDLIKEDLLRRWTFAVWVELLFGLVRGLHGGTVTGGILIPVKNGQLSVLRMQN